MQLTPQVLAKRKVRMRIENQIFLLQCFSNFGLGPTRWVMHLSQVVHVAPRAATNENMEDGTLESRKAELCQGWK